MIPPDLTDASVIVPILAGLMKNKLTVPDFLRLFEGRMSQQIDKINSI